MWLDGLFGLFGWAWGRGDVPSRVIRIRRTPEIGLTAILGIYTRCVCVRDCVAWLLLLWGGGESGKEVVVNTWSLQVK